MIKIFCLSGYTFLFGYLWNEMPNWAKVYWGIMYLVYIFFFFNKNAEEPKGDSQ